MTPGGSKAVNRAKIGLKRPPEASQRPQEVPPEVPKRLSRTPQSAPRVDPCIKCTRSKLSTAQVAAAFVDPTDLLYVCGTV